MKSIRPNFLNGQRPSKVLNSSPKNKMKAPEIHSYKSKSLVRDHDEYIPKQTNQDRNNQHIDSIAQNYGSVIDLYDMNENDKISKKQVQAQFRDQASDFNKKIETFAQNLDFSEIDQKRMQRESKKKLREMQKELERLIKRKQLREKRLQKEIQRKELEKTKRSQMRQTFSEVHHLIYEENSYGPRSNSLEAAKQTKPKQKLKCIRFIKSEQLPLKFPSKEDLAKYSKKLVIAKVLSEKGYSMKSITDYVMSMNSPFIKEISRTEMKTLSFTVISTTVRKLQKFIRVFAKKQVLDPNKEKRGHGSKSFLKKETIKNKSHFLMNFIHKFQIAHKMTFLKFLALEFRMRDVDITIQQAIDLIVYLRRNMEDKDFSHDKLVDIKESFQEEEQNVNDQESIKSNQGQSQVSSRQSEKINELSKLIEKEQQIEQYKADKFQKQKKSGQIYNRVHSKLQNQNLNTGQRDENAYYGQQRNTRQKDENPFSGQQEQNTNQLKTHQKESIDEYENQIYNHYQQNQQHFNKQNTFSQFNYDAHETESRKIYDQLMSEMQEFQDQEQSFIDVLKEVTNQRFNENNCDYIYTQLQNQDYPPMQDQKINYPQYVTTPDHYNMGQYPSQHQIQDSYRQTFIHKELSSQNQEKNINRSRDFDERASQKTSINKLDKFMNGSHCSMLQKQTANDFQIQFNDQEKIDYPEEVQDRKYDRTEEYPRESFENQRRKKKKSGPHSKSHPSKTNQAKQNSTKSKQKSKKIQDKKRQQSIQIQIEQQNQEIKLDLQNDSKNSTKSNKIQNIPEQITQPHKQDQIKEIQIIDLLNSSVEKQSGHVMEKQAPQQQKAVTEQNQGLIIYKLLDEEIMEIILTHPRPQSRFQTDSQPEKDQKASQFEQISIQRITYYMNKKYHNDKNHAELNRPNSQMHPSDSFTEELILSRVCFLFTCVKEYVNLVISNFINQKQRNAENHQKKRNTKKKYDCNQILFEAFEQKVLYVFLQSQATETSKKDSANPKNPNSEKQSLENNSALQYNAEEIEQRILKMNESMRRLIFEQGIKKIFEEQLTNCYKKYIPSDKAHRVNKNKDKNKKLPRIIVSPLHKELLKIYMKFYQSEKLEEKGQHKNISSKQNETDFCELIPFLMDIVDEILHGKKKKKVSKKDQNRIQRQGKKPNSQQGNLSLPKQKKKGRSKKVKQKITNANSIIDQSKIYNETHENRQKQKQHQINQEGENSNFYFGVEEEFKLQPRQAERINDENLVPTQKNTSEQYIVEEIYKDLFLQNDHKGVDHVQTQESNQKVNWKNQKGAHLNEFRLRETFHQQNMGISLECPAKPKQLEQGNQNLTNQNKISGQELQTSQKMQGVQQETISEEDFMSGDEDTPVNILRMFDEEPDSNISHNQNLVIHQLLDISAIKKVDDDGHLSDHFQIEPNLNDPNLQQNTQLRAGNEEYLKQTEVNEILPENSQQFNDHTEELKQKGQQNKKKQISSAFNSYLQLQKCIYDSNLSENKYHAQNIKNIKTEHQQFYPVFQKYEKKKLIKRKRTKKANHKVKSERKQIQNRKLIVIKVKQKSSNIEEQRNQIESKIDNFNSNKNAKNNQKVLSTKHGQRQAFGKPKRTGRKAKKAIYGDSDEDSQAMQIKNKRSRKKQLEIKKMKEMERQEQVVLKKFIKYNKEEAERIVREYEARKGQVEQRKNFRSKSDNIKDSQRISEKQIDENEDWIQEGQLDQQDEENLFYNDFADQNLKKQGLDQTQQPNRNEEVQNNSESHEYAMNQKYENQYEVDFETEKEIEKSDNDGGFKGQISEQDLDNGELRVDLDPDYDNVEFEHRLSGNNVEYASEDVDVHNQLEQQSNGSSQYEIIC